MKLFLKNLISAETDAIGVDGNMFVFKKLHIRVAELLTPSDGLDVVAPAFFNWFHRIFPVYKRTELEQKLIDRP